MRPSLTQIMTALDASKDEASAAVITDFAVFGSAQVVTTGTSTGTLKLQYSNDIASPQVGPTNWSDIPSATASVTGAGVFAIAKFDCCYAWIRAIFTHTNAAAGTISVNLKTSGAS